jgi:hypothetical protein
MDLSLQQILRTTLNLLKVRCMFMFLQMPIIQSQEITSPLYRQSGAFRHGCK